MEILMTILPFVPAVIIAIALIALLASGYVKAPPDVAYIISGLHKKPRILVGKAGIKIPFLERLDKLALGAIQIDVKTGSAVPTAEYINVRVDSTVSVRVGQSEEMIALATFMGTPQEKVNFAEGDLISVITGAWQGTEAVIRSVDAEKQTATIFIDMFGHETPVELNFTDIKKVQ